MNDALFAQPDVQPAIALFRKWESVLDAWDGQVCAFGRFGWALQWQDSTDRDVIGLGQQWGDYNSLNTHFYLARDGRFRLGQMWGWKRRDRITKYTFLRYGHLTGRYQWLAQPEPTEWNTLTDWNARRHYVSEDLLGCRLWAQTPRWVELKQRAGQWQIKPAVQGWPGRSEYVLDEEVVKEWEHYEKLIERRYLNFENRAREDWGTERWGLSDRVPMVKAGKEPLAGAEAVDRLLALIQPEQPAKTTRLTRPKEAQHGEDNLAPTHQL